MLKTIKFGKKIEKKTWSLKNDFRFSKTFKRDQRSSRRWSRSKIKPGHLKSKHLTYYFYFKWKENKN